MLSLWVPLGPRLHGLHHRTVFTVPMQVILLFMCYDLMCCLCFYLVYTYLPLFTCWEVNTTSLPHTITCSFSESYWDLCYMVCIAAWSSLFQCRLFSVYVLWPYVLLVLLPCAYLPTHPPHVVRFMCCILIHLSSVIPLWVPTCRWSFKLVFHVSC